MERALHTHKLCRGLVSDLLQVFFTAAGWQGGVCVTDRARISVTT